MSAEQLIKIPANTPFEFNGLDMRPAFRAGQNGEHTYSINIMVDEKIWEALKTIPRHHLIGGVLYWSTGDEHAQMPVDEEDEIVIQIKPPRKKDKPKGEFGNYWQAMFKAGFHNFPDLHEVLQCSAPGVVKEAIKAEFNVESLTFISPERFETWCKSKQLHSLIALSRQANK